MSLDAELAHAAGEDCWLSKRVSQIQKSSSLTANYKRVFSQNGWCISSGIAAHWKASAYQSILELAEACDVPVRWACRAGVCHSCESGLVSGTVVYSPEPLDKPADGNLLVCCSQPIRDVVIDL